LEHQLKKQLENTCGKEWVSSVDTGNFLKEIWRVGQEYNADELCSRIGGKSGQFDIFPQEDYDSR
jgi:hypothetical protein